MVRSTFLRLLPVAPRSVSCCLRLGLVALLRHVDLPLAAEVLAGDRARRLEDVRVAALRHDFAAVHAGARADVDDVVGEADRVLVVFDHDDGVAEVAQSRQRAEQALVVALVQADRWLVEHVHHADQARADLRGQPDALRLTTGQAAGLAFEREVVEADVDQELQAVADFLDDLDRDLAAPARQRQRVEERQRFVDRQHHDRRQCAIGDEHIARGTVEARAFAVGAGALADVFGEFLAHGGRFGFAVAAVEVRHDAFELVLALRAPARLGEVVERDHVLAAAEQHGLPRLLGQLVPGRVDAEAIMFRQRCDQLEVVRVALVPAAHRAGRQRQFRMHDDARRIEELADAETVAARAGADRRVEREQARFEFRQRVVADRAAVLRREQQRRCVGVIERLHDRHAVAELERGLERFGQTLLHVIAHLEAVDHRLDGVL